MSMALRKEQPGEVKHDEETIHSFLDGWILSVRQNSRWLIGLGVLEVVLGVIAIGVPLVTGIVASLFVGALLVAAGIARIIRITKAQSFGQGSLALLGGVLGIICGLLILGQPLLGLKSITLLLTAYFAAEGVSSLFLSFKVKPHGGWGWLLIDGIITTLLAVLIVAEWPLSGVWALGTLIGIDIIFTGIAAISIGWAARRAAMRS